VLGRRRIPRPTRRLGLRQRVTLAFGLLTLALSTVLSLVGWGVVSQYLVDERQSAAIAQADLHHSLLAEGIVQRKESVALLLGGLPNNGSEVGLAVVGGRWYATSPHVAPASLPNGLVSAVIGGDTATQRIMVDGRLYLVVGVPLAQSDDAFFELFPLAQTEETLRSLSWVIVVAATGTVLIGLGFGRVASRIALRPLNRLNDVAGAVAAGHLEARLPSGGDPDLEPLAVSFNRTVAELQHRVTADARFAADVGHELRTPLMTMLNSLQLIKHRENQLPAEVREALDLLSDDLKRFRTLVVDLLEISRHDAGEDLVLAQAEIGQLVRLAADGALQRPVTRVDDNAAGLVLAVDRRRLERAIVNLVAIAEVHGGGCVLVHVTRTGHVVRIEVDDNGPGVPEARRPLVFDRFTRGPSVESAGVGLGLAIVQRHVAAHGGTVTVESRPGGGARFVIELPLSRS
jgi:signal transduction histidine kinase